MTVQQNWMLGEYSELGSSLYDGQKLCPRGAVSVSARCSLLERFQCILKLQCDLLRGAGVVVVVVVTAAFHGVVAGGLNIS